MGHACADLGPRDPASDSLDVVVETPGRKSARERRGHASPR